MRVPTEILIAGHRVSISYPNEIPLEAGDEVSPYGDTTHDGRTIRISKSKHKNEREVFATLYHESMHAAFALTGLANLVKDEVEEAFVTGLENAVVHLFAFHPKAPGVKWRDIQFPFEE